MEESNTINLESTESTYVKHVVVGSCTANVNIPGVLVYKSVGSVHSSEETTVVGTVNRKCVRVFHGVSIVSDAGLSGESSEFSGMSVPEDVASEHVCTAWVGVVVGVDSTPPEIPIDSHESKVVSSVVKENSGSFTPVSTSPEVGGCIPIGRMAESPGAIVCGSGVNVAGTNRLSGFKETPFTVKCSVEVAFGDPLAPAKFNVGSFWVDGSGHDTIL